MAFDKKLYLLHLSAVHTAARARSIPQAHCSVGTILINPGPTLPSGSHCTMWTWLWMHRLSRCEVAGNGQHCSEPPAQRLARDLPNLMTQQCPKDSPAHGGSCWEPSRGLQERLSTCVSASLNRNNKGNNHLAVLNCVIYGGQIHWWERYPRSSAQQIDLKHSLSATSTCSPPKALGYLLSCNSEQSWERRVLLHWHTSIWPLRVPPLTPGQWWCCRQD